MSPCPSDVGRAVANARLRACVRGAREAERVLVEVRGLLRVPDPDLDVVPAVDGMKSCSLMGRSLCRLGRESSAGAEDRHRDQRAADDLQQAERLRQEDDGEDAATNGCRFTASVARAGPIRPSDRNQSTFVSTSGPRVANASRAQTSQPTCQS